MPCADCEDCTVTKEPAMSGPHCHHELHITVEPAQDMTIDDFVQACEFVGVRPLVMALVGPGRRRHRDWFTGSSLNGSDLDARRQLAILGDRLAGLGLDPIRAKIEAAPWHYRAPQGHQDGTMPSDAYWESHVSAWIEPDEVDELGATLRGLGGYLSLNVLKGQREDGLVRASATCRSTKFARYAQENSVLMLRDIIRRAGHEVESKTRTEFTWLDLAYDPERFGGPPRR